MLKACGRVPDAAHGEIAPTGAHPEEMRGATTARRGKVNRLCALRLRLRRMRMRVRWLHSVTLGGIHNMTMTNRDSAPPRPALSRFVDGVSVHGHPIHAVSVAAGAALTSARPPRISFSIFE